MHGPSSDAIHAHPAHHASQSISCCDTVHCIASSPPPLLSGGLASSFSGCHVVLVILILLSNAPHEEDFTSLLKGSHCFAFLVVFRPILPSLDVYVLLSHSWFFPLSFKPSHKMTVDPLAVPENRDAPRPAPSKKGGAIHLEGPSR